MGRKTKNQKLRSKLKYEEQKTFFSICAWCGVSRQNKIWGKGWQFVEIEGRGDCCKQCYKEGKFHGPTFQTRRRQPESGEPADTTRFCEEGWDR